MPHYNFSFPNKLLQFFWDFFPLDVTPNFLQMLIFTNILANRLFNNATHYHNFTRDHFVMLLRLSVKNGHFIFNGSVFKQVDNVAMGSPLRPILGNIFLSFHKLSFKGNCRQQCPLFLATPSFNA